MTPPTTIVLSYKTYNTSVKRKFLPHTSTIFMTVKTHKTYVKSKFLTQFILKKEKKKVEL